MERVMDMGDNVFLATVASAGVCSLLIFAFLGWLKWSSRRKSKGKGQERPAHGAPLDKNSRGNARRQRRKKSGK